MIEFEPYLGEDGFPEYAEYSPLAQCEEHGLERLITERTISTGYDKCVVRVFACGLLCKDDIF